MSNNRQRGGDSGGMGPNYHHQLIRSLDVAPMDQSLMQGQSAFYGSGPFFFLVTPATTGAPLVYT